MVAPTYLYLTLLTLRQWLGLRASMCFHSYRFWPRLLASARREALRFTSHEIAPVTNSKTSLPLRRHQLPPRSIRGLAARSEMVGVTIFALFSLLHLTSAVRGWPERLLVWAILSEAKAQNKRRGRPVPLYRVC